MALVSIEQTLRAQNDRKRDIIVPASKLSFYEGNLMVQLKGGITNTQAFEVNEVCHPQIAERLEIPAAYYRRMRNENPQLLEENVNSWLAKMPKENKRGKENRFMLRTLTGVNPERHIARALLSNSYNCIDNYDVLSACMEAIAIMKVNVEIKRAEVTDKRFYLQITCPDVEIQAEEFLRGYIQKHDGVGNGIVSGLSISNSEVGCGMFSISPRAVVVKCNNGMMMKDDAFKKIHLGAALEEGEVIWSEHTRLKNYELVIAKAQDAIRTFLGRDYLGRMIEKIAELKNIPLTYQVDCVQNVCRNLAISENHMQNVLAYFLTDGDQSAAGVLHAITRESQKMHADLQFEVENSVFETLKDIKKFDKPFSKN